MTVASFTTQHMGIRHLDECWALDQQVFEHGEVYDRYTFRDLLTNPSAINLRAVTGDQRMIGFVVGMVESDFTGHIVVLGVAETWRRLGVGKELMRDVEQRFAAREVRMLHLEVRTANTAAQALYSQIGFRIAGRRLAYYTNGDDAFLMVKLIG